MKREYRYPLSLEDELVVEMEIERSNIVDFKVMYNTIIKGKEHQVVRYDCAHGYAHKDILYEKPKRKEIMADIEYDELLDIAKDDIERNWEQYKKKYLRLMQCE